MIDIVIGPKQEKKIAKPPDCLKCVHFSVSWDAVFPRSCAVFEFKTKQLPSVEVLRATGTNCPSFQLKKGLKA
ncbi:MAG: hypothetical protein LBG79_02120 [Spirochaetaceae bacterium]|jgi:hypothetical protein|nr:hypothetical protein [Spirochaetaceae bacterium]GMO18667.1 MAG: hypothetical protein Pg6A_05330 [Termitinemataceae bacterium]